MNNEIAEIFEQIADLLEISGGDQFRINTYRRTARTIQDLTEEVSELAHAGNLQTISGIGKSTAAKIQEYIDTGEIALLSELKKTIPPGLPRLLSIQGLGPKTVAVIHKQLDVVDIEGLKQVIESGELQSLPRMGAKSVEKIAEGIKFLESSSQRTPRGIALPIAETIVEYLSELDEVEDIQIAGSLRRGMETVHDVDVLCTSTKPKKIIEAFVNSPNACRILAAGDTKGSITVASGLDNELQIDLRVVPKKSLGAALQYFTGSKEHNVRLREMAIKKSFKLNEWGLFDGDRVIAGKTEAEVYKALDLTHIPPELREDQVEFDPDTNFDNLITSKDLLGDLHLHTTASDGINTIEELAEAAAKLGHKYLAITDHSGSSSIANGLSPERLAKHIRNIHKVNGKMKDITVLAGCECDILPDGSLDYPDNLLADCDIVIASIHSAMTSKPGKGKLSPTDRTLAAIDNPSVHIIGHPTGRLLGQRPPMEIDIKRITHAAATSNTALEINSSWQRLDLKDLHIKQALQAGAFLAINTDAHRTDNLGRFEHGVSTARRALVTPASVINSMTLSKLKRWLAKH